MARRDDSAGAAVSVQYRVMAEGDAELAGTDRVPVLAGVVVVMAMGLAGVGCGDGEEGSYIEPVPVAGEIGLPRGNPPYFPDERARPPSDLDWERCALFSGGLDVGAECATVAVPLRWAEPDGETIELFVKRYRATSEPRGQLWLLAGGPGGSGAEFDFQVFDEPIQDFYPSFGEMAPDLEIYLLDHRGTGRSSRLGCPSGEDPAGVSGRYVAEEEWADCLTEVEGEWGPRLAGFTITEAATDLGMLVDRTRHGDEPVFVYGVSYGTLWAQRYLHVFPRQASGVVLDSICSPGECELTFGYDDGFDEVGNAILDLCGADADCRAGFDDGNVGAALDAVIAGTLDGNCDAVGLDLDPADVRLVLGLMLRSWPLRDLVPATIARLRECDAEALARLFSVLVPSGESPADALFSSFLNHHIGLSELTRVPPPTADEVEAHVNSLRFSLDAGLDFVHRIEAGWPTYPHDEFTGQLATSDVPMLMMNGTLDPQTPLSVAETTGNHFDGAHQTFVVVPYATHSVLNQSPIELESDRTVLTCGQLLLEQFLADPLQPIDTGCTDEVMAPDFVNQRRSEALFGVADPFASDPAATDRMRSRVVVPRPLRRDLN
jgi:pimeloyl-ACP methyl ester carboxylesterase